MGAWTTLVRLGPPRWLVVNVSKLTDNICTFVAVDICRYSVGTTRTSNQQPCSTVAGISQVVQRERGSSLNPLDIPVFVVSTSAVDYLDRFISEMICYGSSETAHSLTEPLGCLASTNVNCDNNKVFYICVPGQPR